MHPITLTTTYIVLAELLLSASIVQMFRLSGASTRLSIGLGATMLAWIAALAVGIPAGWFLPEQVSHAGMYAIILAGAGGLAGAILAIPAVRSHLLAMPPELLLFPQTLRVLLGAGFLIEAALGVLPTTFGIMDGMTHVTAGFLAMSAALGLALWQRRFRRGVWIATIFGVADILAVATGIAFVLIDEISTRHNMMIAVFFVAPILLALHAASVWQMLAGRWPTRGVEPLRACVSA